MTKQTKYYAVRQGRRIGIFTDWDECKRLVTGYKGAEFKSFLSRDDALEYMGASRSGQSTPEPSEDTAVAYVDGSYNAKTKVFSCGVVLLLQDGEKTFAESFDDAELSQMRNVAGEIRGAMKAISLCTELGLKNLHIFYDYAGIEKWCTGEWKTNKSGTIEFKRFYDDASGKINIKFHKVKGHSGDKYNDMADQLAKQAAGI